MVQQQTQK